MPLDYVVKRFGLLLVTVILGVTINFMLPRMMPDRSNRN
jgi:ABC-type dipeptide/oligopeptide/nickel transport system permease component